MVLYGFIGFCFTSMTSHEIAVRLIRRLWRTHAGRQGTLSLQVAWDILNASAHRNWALPNDVPRELYDDLLAFFGINVTATSEVYTLSQHAALPICARLLSATRL